MTNRPPIALSIAGTDPSGGAGIHADLKAFTARGVLGTTAITALLAQNTHGVTRVEPVAVDFVADQIESVIGDMPVDATKTGMLGTRALVETVAEYAGGSKFGFLTVDPVMVATSGQRLLDLDAVDAVRSLVMPRADLITPNLPEAALLLGDDVPPATSVEEMVAQARELQSRGARSVLLKGGHAPDGDVFDVLLTSDAQVTRFTHSRVNTANTHGTGCTLSAAITAEVARAKRERGLSEVPGDILGEAVSSGLDYLARALESAASWQVALDPVGAHGPVDHQVDINAQRTQTKLLTQTNPDSLEE